MVSWWNLKLITKERDDQNPSIQSIFSLGHQECWSSKAICLTPANLPTLKSKVILPPPGWFLSTDIYSRKRSRKVQHIANESWSRWRKEFLQTFQEQKTRKTRRRNSQNRGIVLLKAETYWNHWPIARIIETFEDEHGVERTVKLKLGSKNNPQRELAWPIAKIVLLVEGDSRTESQGLNQNVVILPLAF